MYTISNILFILIDWSQRDLFFFLLLKPVVWYFNHILKPLEIWYNWLLMDHTNIFLKLTFIVNGMVEKALGICRTSNVIHNFWTEIWHKKRIRMAFLYCRWKRDLMAGCLGRGLGEFRTVDSFWDRRVEAFFWEQYKERLGTLMERPHLLQKMIYRCYAK